MQVNGVIFEVQNPYLSHSFMGVLLSKDKVLAKVKVFRCPRTFPSLCKGPAISDLGGVLEEIFKTKFFHRNPFCETIFLPGEGLSKKFFSGEGPPKNAFLNFLWPSPQIINGGPLR